MSFVEPLFFLPAAPINLADEQHENAHDPKNKLILIFAEESAGAALECSRLFPAMVVNGWYVPPVQRKYISR